MSEQEQQNLEKTLTILKKKLEQAQQQYKQTKKTIHTKKAFLLSSKSLLQQDFQHAFLINNNKRKRKPRALLSIIPSGLLPLISTKEPTFKKKEPTTIAITVNQHIKVISCIGIIVKERIWFRMIINNQSNENIAQANMALMPINWISFEILRSTLHNISALSNHILYAAMMVPPNLSPEKLVSTDLKSSCKYMLENGDWLESSAISIQWINKKDDHQYKQWMIDDRDNIATWAPIFFPYKIHLSYADLLDLKDWIRLDENILITPDKSLLFIKSDNINTLSPIQAHLFGLKEQTIASWLYKTKLDKYIIPYDGINIDTYHRLKNIIISLMDLQSLSTESSSYNHLINRENSIVQLSSLIP